MAQTPMFYIPIWKPAVSQYKCLSSLETCCFGKLYWQILILTSLDEGNIAQKQDFY